MVESSALLTPDPDAEVEDTEVPEWDDDLDVEPTMLEVPVEAALVSGRRVRRRRMIAAGAVVAAILALVVILLNRGGDSPPVRTASLGQTSGHTATSSTISSTTSPSQTTTPANGTTVTVNADVLFAVDSAELTSSASTELGGVLALAAKNGDRQLLVEGYSDNDGDPVLNQQLSEARAQSVAQWLTQQGIDGGRISVVGHGAADPVAPNDTPEHKALNRRVVVTLRPPAT